MAVALGLCRFDILLTILLFAVSLILASQARVKSAASTPDGGNTPFRGEKGTTWEGGFRVPCLARWPGVIKPGIVINEITSHEDWLPMFLAAAGDDPRRPDYYS